MATANLDRLKDSFPLSKAPEIVGDGSSPGKWHRWAFVGVLDANGNRVKLTTFRHGGRRMVDRAAIDEFLRAINDEGHEENSVASTDATTDVAARGRAARKALAGVIG